MKIQLTKQELANLFSQALNITILEDDVYIKENDVGGESVVILDGIPVDTLIKFQKLKPNNLPSKIEVASNLLNVADNFNESNEEESENQVDILTMEDLQAQNTALTNKDRLELESIKRPLGPKESFVPPEITEAELNAVRR